MFIYKIIDIDEPSSTLGYAATFEDAKSLANQAARHYAELDFTGAIQVHRYITDELYLGGVYWETLVETISF